MKVHVDTRELVDEERATPASVQALRRGLWAKLRAVSFALERRIKDAMPVDTGRARASWGHWSPGDLRASDTDAKSSDGHWKESEIDLMTEQGSNVEYIEALNAGHSQQAPALFIDMAEIAAEDALLAEVDAMLTYWES